MDFTLSYFDYLIIFSILLYGLYMYCTWNYGRFKKGRVPHNKPLFFVGNSLGLFTKKEHLVHNIGHAYIDFPDARFSGYFSVRTPVILIRDPELIRQIAVKDFDHFVDHQSLVDETQDPLLGCHVLALKGQKWRDMRATLSPAFTGSKMRNMYSLVSECAQQMAEYMKKETAEKGPMVCDTKDLFTRYTNDVIATSAFGLKVDSLNDRENEFYKMGKFLTDPSVIQNMLRAIGILLMPRIMKLLKIRLLSDKCANFFRELVHGTMKVREEKGIVRPDMIHLLMQARQGTLQHDNTNTTLTQQQDAGFATVAESDVGKENTKKRVWTDDELTAQALVFFLAGFEPTSVMLCFTVHELSVNPDVQKRLQQEIDEVCEEYGENEAPNYERINRMKYLDMVVTESLRLWPPATFTDRQCVKTYDIEDYDGNKHRIEQKDSVFIPIYHIHRDEKYYENPEKFDPERFSDENKKNIKPFTYMPFGVGPRNCIGSRFALMEIKAILFHMLRHFDFLTCYKTMHPLELSKKNAVQMKPEKGFWLEISPRKVVKM